MNIAFFFLICKTGIIQLTFQTFSDLEKRVGGNEAVCNEQIVNQALREKLSQCIGWEPAKIAQHHLLNPLAPPQDALSSF